MTRWTLSIAELVQFDPGYLLAPQGGLENSTTCSTGRVWIVENSTSFILTGNAHSLEERKAAYQPCLQWINFFHSPLCFRLFTIVSSTATYKAAILKSNVGKTKQALSHCFLFSFIHYFTSIIEPTLAMAYNGFPACSKTNSNLS